ncbi:hypothetical protein F4819DRAFT_377366 [Hypoxylon fuscum]|nr:hypothetical protein F4819DRAFT_377366 [Hypoxylon fuscum]
MVAIRSLLAAAAAALPFSSAYITGMSAPATAKAGANLTVGMTAAIYVQNWDDFGIVWGLAPAAWDCGEYVCVGQRIGYTPLFPNNIPQPGNFSLQVSVPQGFTPGDYKLVAAIPYLVGASGMTQIQVHNASITITA